MAELATLARPYAGAVFDIAKSAHELDRWSRMLAVLASVSIDAGMKILLEAPEVDEEEKARQLSDVCGDEINDEVQKFVQVLAENKRLPLLGEISRQFEELRALEQQSLDVVVTSAFEMSQAEQSQLKSALHRRFAKEITLTSEVDSSLIGGAVIRAGDTVIDGSIRGKLSKLAESIQRT